MPSETLAPALIRDLVWHPVTAQGHVHMPGDTAVSARDIGLSKGTERDSKPQRLGKDSRVWAGTDEPMCLSHSLSGRGWGALPISPNIRESSFWKSQTGVTHSCLQASRDSDSLFLITLAIFIRKVTVWH